jgi:hypothetical protein
MERATGTIRSRRWPSLALGACAVIAAAGGLARGEALRARWFADRAVAWSEHDDADVPARPEANHLQDLETALTIRDSVMNEADRLLAVENRPPAQDVNALDEVPCSTWFCARNHLAPMTPEEIAAGPPATAPVPPFTILKGKDQGSAVGFQVVDSVGHKFMLKLDPAGHLGLTTSAEMVGNRIFHAAGYNVPGAFLVDVAPVDLRIDRKASFKRYKVQKRPLTEAHVLAQLDTAARLPDGRLRAVAVPWIGGDVLGSFDMLGQRPGDPNDRIPHQHRRSLRASWVLFAWLSVLDPSSINTIDSYLSESGRHFVRHYFFDFSCTFGSATSYAQGPQQDGEYLVEVGRTLAALFSFGLYHRPFQDQRAEWLALNDRFPAIGYFPAESFDPDQYRSNRKLPPHMRITARDAYWGAKLVTSFSDAQLAALIGVSGLPARDAAYAEHALRVRRDIIGRRYLRAEAAVEKPEMAADGASVCFDDLAVARGYADPAELAYSVDVGDGYGVSIARGEQPSTGARACVGIGGAGRGTGYRAVTIRSQLAGGAGRPGGAAVSKAARIHLRWRDAERRFVVVGLERDE